MTSPKVYNATKEDSSISKDVVINEGVSQEARESISKRLTSRELFEAVTKNYESWQHVINKNGNKKRFSDLQHIVESESDESKEPIFDGVLLDALEKISLNTNESQSFSLSKSNSIEISQRSDVESPPDVEVREEFGDVTLRKSEIEYLKKTISQVVKSRSFSFLNGLDSNGINISGISIKKDQHCSQLNHASQDDYDINEIDGDFSKDSNTHHIEVEINAIAENGANLEIAGNSGSYFSLDTTGSMDGALNEEASCELTFECDEMGNLISSNSKPYEQKKSIGNGGNSSKMVAMSHKDISSAGLHSINREIDSDLGDLDKKNRKKKKKKKKSGTQRSTLDHSEANFRFESKEQNNCCLLCEYELIYGTKPRHLISMYDEKVRAEDRKRLQLKNKLKEAKSRALKKQKEIQEKHNKAMQSKNTNFNHEREEDSSL